MNRTTTHQGPNPDEIHSLFSSIAHGYDRANDLMTFGMARLWRKRLVKMSEAKVGSKILDCASGTGDLALDFKRVVGSTGEVIGTDFCEDMLKPAPLKAQKAGLDVKFEVADAMNLPYDDNTFDVTSISYGIRNVGDPARALSEMARVTKPGGHVMVLETGNSQLPLMGFFYRLYFNKVVPRLGALVTGQKSAYEYLNKSSSQFPCREAFLNLMDSTAAFSHAEYKSLMGGASFIYKATVK